MTIFSQQHCGIFPSILSNHIFGFFLVQINDHNLATNHFGILLVHYLRPKIFGYTTDLENFFPLLCGGLLSRTGLGWKKVSTKILSLSIHWCPRTSTWPSSRHRKMASDCCCYCRRHSENWQRLLQRESLYFLYTHFAFYWCNILN